MQDYRRTLAENDISGFLIALKFGQCARDNFRSGSLPISSVDFWKPFVENCQYRANVLYIPDRIHDQGALLFCFGVKLLCQLLETRISFRARLSQRKIGACADSDGKQHYFSIFLIPLFMIPPDRVMILQLLKTNQAKSTPPETLATESCLQTKYQGFR